MKEGAKRIRVHILTDGRDVPDGSSKRYVEELEADLAVVAADGCDAKIASGGGRMGVTMDRYEVTRELTCRTPLGQNRFPTLSKSALRSQHLHHRDRLKV